MSSPKLSGAIAWNLGSVIVLAVSGVGVNVLIGRIYGAHTLGVFNQVMSFYLVFSQLAAFGFHYSALKYVAEHRNDEAVSRRVAHTSILLAAASGAITCGLGYLTLPLVSRFFESEDVTAGWRLVLPTLIPFAVNKVLMALINAHERMRTFAVMQSMRYIIILAMLCLVIFRDLPRVYVAAVIGAAETVLTFVLIPLAFRHFRPVLQIPTSQWLKTHFRFGSKGYLTAATLELNAKVDILILGVFLDDHMVGIYSIAALFLEGLMQIGTAIRNVFNPKITRLFTSGQKEALTKMAAEARPKLAAGAVASGLLALAFFPVFVKWVIGDDTFMEGWVALALLVVGFVLYAPQYPFSMLFIQSGYPGTQTVYNGMSALTNFALNLALVPLLGIRGSALATGISLFLSALILRRMSRKVLGVTI